MQRLLEAGVSLGEEVNRAKLAWLGRFAARTPCFSLTYSSLQDADAALRSIG